VKYTRENSRMNDASRVDEVLKKPTRELGYHVRKRKKSPKDKKPIGKNTVTPD